MKYEKPYLKRNHPAQWLTGLIQKAIRCPSVCIRKFDSIVVVQCSSNWYNCGADGGGGGGGRGTKRGKRGGSKQQKLIAFIIGNVTVWLCLCNHDVKWALACIYKIYIQTIRLLVLQMLFLRLLFNAMVIYTGRAAGHILCRQVALRLIWAPHVQEQSGNNVRDGPVARQRSAHTKRDD